MGSKPFYRSKTLWVNVLTLIVLVAGVMSENPQYGELAKWAALALPIANVLLRFVTDQAISLTKR